VFWREIAGGIECAFEGADVDTADEREERAQPLLQRALDAADTGRLKQKAV
jgi:hypothetical protein